MIFSKSQIFSIIGGLVLASTASATKMPVLVDLSQGFQMDGKASSLTTYVNTTIKINDEWDFSPETKNFFAWKDGGKSHTVVTHGYLRFPFTAKNVATFGDFRLNLTYRYRPPTAGGDQVQGHLGQLAFIPNLSGKAEGFSFTFKNAMLGWMQRRENNKYTKFYGGDLAPKGNYLLGNQFETIISYDIFEGFSLFLDDTAENILVGKANGSAKRTWQNTLYQEYGIGYTIKPLALDVSLNVDNKSDMSPKGDFKFWTKKTANYNVELTRVF